MGRKEIEKGRWVRTEEERKDKAKGDDLERGKVAEKEKKLQVRRREGQMREEN